MVKDRRIFTEENLDAEPEEEKEPPAAEKEKEATADETGQEPDAETQEPPPKLSRAIWIMDSPPSGVATDS